MKGSEKNIIWLQASLRHYIITENRHIQKGFGCSIGDSNNFQPKRSVSEMYLIVEFKIILLASKGKFLFPYRRSCNILISALSGCPQALSTSLTPARRLHLCCLKELQSSKKCSVSSMPSLTGHDVKI